MFEAAEASLGAGSSNTRQPASCHLQQDSLNARLPAPAETPAYPTPSLAATFHRAFKLDHLWLDGHTDDSVSATLGDFWFLLAGSAPSRDSGSLRVPPQGGIKSEGTLEKQGTVQAGHLSLSLWRPFLEAGVNEHFQM